MAGTLTISTLSDGTNSTSSTNCIQGSAKAWVNFQATTSPSINASYNVSSVTRAAAGTWTISFTNALSDNNYALSGTWSYQTGYTNIACVIMNGNFAKTASQCQIYTVQASSTATDLSGPAYAIFHR